MAVSNRGIVSVLLDIGQRTDFIRVKIRLNSPEAVGMELQLFKYNLERERGELLLGNIGNIFFAQENFPFFGHESHAETVLVVIADMSLKLFPGFHNHGDLGMRIDQMP